MYGLFDTDAGYVDLGSWLASHVGTRESLNTLGDGNHITFRSRNNCDTVQDLLGRPVRKGCTNANHLRGGDVDALGEPRHRPMPVVLLRFGLVGISARTFHEHATVRCQLDSQGQTSRGSLLDGMSTPKTEDVVSVVASSDIFGPNTPPLIVAVPQQDVRTDTLGCVDLDTSGAQSQRALSTADMVKQICKRTQI